VLFALFRWVGTAFLMGRFAGSFGRTQHLRLGVGLLVFTGAAALAENFWQLGAFRLLGIVIGGEWALAAPISEAWPEDAQDGPVPAPATTPGFFLSPR